MLKQSFFTERRQALAQQLANNSAAIVFSAQEKTRSNDTEYHFRQDSTFYYFTGFNEPESVLVMVKRDEQLQTILFNREKD
ncbi:MAG: aminopeptidase P N-terminal domain-containing protein, partial [Psychrobium sp.]